MYNERIEIKTFLIKRAKKKFNKKKKIKYFHLARDPTKPMLVEANAVNQNKTAEISLPLPMQIYLPKIVISPPTCRSIHAGQIHRQCLETRKPLSCSAAREEGWVDWRCAKTSYQSIKFCIMQKAKDR